MSLGGTAWSGDEAIANYVCPLCIACDCFVARPTLSALRLAIVRV